MDVLYRDRQGNVISMEEWSRLLGDMEYKRVAYDEIPDTDIRISTVWLGLNHQYGDGPPLIFETMVFGGPNDESMWRYSTEEEALAGHAERLKENNIVVVSEVRDQKVIES